MLQHTYLTYLILSGLLLSNSLYGQAYETTNRSESFTLSGYVEDAANGEKLIGVVLYDAASGQGTTTNLYGFYSLTLNTDSIYLVVSYIGMQKKYYKLKLTEDITLNIQLSEAEAKMEAVEILASEHEESQEEQVQMSQVSIPIEQIKKLPTFLGEVDVLRALQLLPGIQSGNEGNSGFYVRGGSPDQNLILLDGIPIYNASHLFGFFSVFNADVIKNVKLTKGGYPARFGGRLSSILEVNMKEGNNKAFQMEGSIGLISSKLCIEGPILKDKTSFILSARRTYIDLVSKPYFYFTEARNTSEQERTIPGYYFYDINAKVHHKFNPKHRLSLSFYSGNDHFNYQYQRQSQEDSNSKIFEQRNQLRWGNLCSSIAWNYLITDKLFAHITAIHSRYHFEIGMLDKKTTIDTSNTFVQSFLAKYFSGIEDLGLKIDLDYVPSTQHYIRFGINNSYHRFKPGALNLRNEDNLNNIDLHHYTGNQHITAGEFAAYIEDDWKLNKKLRINLGLHASAFYVNPKFYYSLQPRIALAYLLDETFAIKASFVKMTQYIHLLSNEGIGMPSDLWVPSTENIPEEHSLQLAIGLSKNFNQQLSLSIEGFYKDLKGLISYKPGASFIQAGSNWEDQIESNGKGNSYGVEILVEKKHGNFRGWIGYTLAWSNRHFPNTAINSGHPYPFKYDRRHDLSISSIYEFNKKVNVSAVWVFGSGNMISLPLERFGSTQNWGIAELQGYHAKNGYRMAPYHRLDLSIDLHFYKTKWKHQWSFGIYNVYSRQNPFFIFSEKEAGSNKLVFKQASLFPIIPSIRWNFKI